MFKWFGSKKKEEVTTHLADYSFLGIDIHSHYVPGIDDGSKDIEESLAMIQAMQQLGYRGLVTTPHINFDHYPNTSEKILKGLTPLKEALEANGIQMPIRAAAEYYIDDHFMQLLDRGEKLLTINDNHVLLEFSFVSEPAQLHSVFFKVQTLGYKPVIAHPERYLYFHQKPEIYQTLKDRGYLLQLNVLSLAGYYGSNIKEIAENLLHDKMYDYCGSDMHHIKHASVLKKFVGSRLFNKLQAQTFLNTSVKI